MRTYHCSAFRLETRVLEGQGSDVAQLGRGQGGTVHEIKISTPNAYPIDFTVDSSVAIGQHLVSYAAPGGSISQWSPRLLGVDAANPKATDHALAVALQGGPARLSINRVQFPTGWGGAPHHHNLALNVDLAVL